MTVTDTPHPELHRHEFVALIAAIMAVNALGVDLMLPALPAIGRDLAVLGANAQQWVVTAYIFGLGVGQLLYGPLADRYGRKPVLLSALAGFVAASLFAATAQGFAALVAARVLQGSLAAASRVLSVALVRDCYSGRRMAQTMSLAQMVFFLVPILAPTIGQGLLLIGPWRFIFYVLGGFGAAVFGWAALRLPETLPHAARRPISLDSLASAYRITLTDRFSVGYALAGALTFGAIIAFVSSSEQIFVDTFHQGKRFTLLFGLCALAMSFASFANSRLVERLGTRVISHSGIICLILLSITHALIVWSGTETLWTFVALQALSLVCIGLCGANFGAMAMAAVGHVAGTASSIQGFITTLVAAAIGSAIGQSYDGTTLPLAGGYLCIGLGAITLIWFVEGGRLFRSRLVRD